ncbi:hypothetical protein CPC698_0819B, partial [Chlamydia psittaci C6/98]
RNTMGTEKIPPVI